MNDGITLNEVCNRLGVRNEKPEFVVRRIRHWTNERLIPTKGDMHSGKGRHRLYTLTGLVAAGTLWELSRYNLPVNVLDKVMPAIVEMAEEWEWELENKSILVTDNKFSNQWMIISFDEENNKFDSPVVELEGYPIKEVKLNNNNIVGGSAIIINMEKVGEYVIKV